jgi:glycosyltransferase involved in cell wall biosynthesis
MNRENPRVSVGMPVYNGERHLHAAIESILGQTFQDLELIISDNASTDATESICREYAAKDPRVRYHRQPKNLGVSENYNAAFRLARGPYFKWASSNDICDRRFLETCAQELDRHPEAVLAYPKTRLIRGEPPGMEDYEDRLDLPYDRPCDRFRAYIERYHLNNVMNGIIRADDLKGTPLMARFPGSDLVLMAELTLHGKFVEVPEFLFFRRMDASSATPMRNRSAVHRLYDPELKRRMRFQRWKFHRACFWAVWRTPLRIREKLCLYRFLWRRFFQDRGYLARELREAAGAGPKPILVT